jgi:hypothetical protein
MGLQKVIWYDETLTADVFDEQDNFVRKIQYTLAEYIPCKQLYLDMRKIKDLEQRGKN